MSRPIDDGWVTVRTPARLHFGLLAAETDGQRSFGGAGLMLREPNVTLRARRILGPRGRRLTTARAGVGRSISERTAELHSLTADRHPNLPGTELAIDAAPPEHVGLGVGTQLSLAVAAVLDCLATGGKTPAVELARIVGRGRRSGVGVHGFAAGGFLVDGGKPTASPAEAVAPLVARHSFPAHWPILLILPTLPALAKGAVGLHGDAERRAFARDVWMPSAVTDRLCRLLVLGMIPAVVERDYPAFADALYEYNHTVGEGFSVAQGGAYAHPLLAEIVARVRSRGVP
ncbi:MAG: beta-ribofuranosylaminobenzene 5'-phosphate synthase family protein, partial [Planctomycetia bacterium]